MNKKLLSIFLLSLLLVTFVKAQDSTTVVMTLDDAISSAFANNHAIAAAENDIQYSRHMKKASWGYRLPQISASAAYIGMEKDFMSFDEIKNNALTSGVEYLRQKGITVPQELVDGLLGFSWDFSLQKKTFGFANVSAALPIYAGGRINALNRANTIKIDQSENELDITKSDLFTEITERYWGLALSKSLESLHSDVVDCITSHHKDALMLEKSGMIAKTERMYAEMALSKAKASYVEARNNTDVVNSALSGSTGAKGELNPITSLFVTDSIPDLGFFKQKVEENALLLKKVNFYKQLAEENVKGKRAAFYPTLAAMGTAIIGDYQLTSLLPRYYYGVTASLRIFDGLKSEQEYLASKSQLKKVEELEAKAQTDIQILAEKLYYEMMGAKEQVDAMESTIKFAEEYFRAKNAAFKEGMATSNDVVDAELNLSKCKIERMAEAYKFDVALSKLLAMTGDWAQYSSYQLTGREIK